MQYECVPAILCVPAIQCVRSSVCVLINKACNMSMLLLTLLIYLVANAICTARRGLSEPCVAGLAILQGLVLLVPEVTGGAVIMNGYFKLSQLS